jgi:uncharacterized protein
MKAFLLRTQNAIINFFKDQPLVKFGLILGLALIISFNTLSGAIREREGEESISVTGSASKMITADQGSWTIRYSRQGKDLKTVYAQLEKDAGVVKAFLKKEGLTESAYSVATVDSTTLYAKNSQGYDSNVVEAYKLEQSILVESDDPKKIDALSQQGIELINKGPFWILNHPSISSPNSMT